MLHGDGNCTNNVPSNLRWGTHDENLKEAVQHGRIGRGENHPRAKITDEDVRAIRAGPRSLARYKDLAAQFSVSWWHIQKIAAGTVRGDVA